MISITWQPSRTSVLQHGLCQTREATRANARLLQIPDEPAFYFEYDAQARYVNYWFDPMCCRKLSTCCMTYVERHTTSSSAFIARNYALCNLSTRYLRLCRWCFRRHFPLYGCCVPTRLPARASGQCLKQLPLCMLQRVRFLQSLVFFCLRTLLQTLVSSAPASGSSPRCCTRTGGHPRGKRRRQQCPPSGLSFSIPRWGSPQVFFEGGHAVRGVAAGLRPT